MVCPKLCRAFVLALGLCLVMAVAPPTAQSAESVAERKIREELATPTQFEFNETPLLDVVSYLAELHGINVKLDQKKMEEANVSRDTPITHVLKGVSLASALNLVLGSLGLTYVIENEVLLITSPENAQRASTPRVYDVAGASDEKDRETLLKAVELVLDAPATGADGKPIPTASRLLIFRDKLMLRGSHPEHDRAAALLVRLGATPRPQGDEGPPPRRDDDVSGRFRWHDGRWWYWTPSERWVYWENGRWNG